jgi:hypothetical protein
MAPEKHPSVNDYNKWTEFTPPICWQLAAIMSAETDLLFWAMDDGILTCNIICNDVFFDGPDDFEISPIEVVHIYSRIKDMPELDDKFCWVMEWVATKRGTQFQQSLG